jgi:DNA-binding transcriptional regulator YiaG
MNRAKEVAFDFKGERVSYRLSQTEVAAILFVNQSQISRWEKHGNMPRAYQELWKNWKAQQPE